LTIIPYLGKKWKSGGRVEGRSYGVVRVVLPIHLKNIVESFLDGQFAEVGELAIYEKAVLRVDLVKDVALLGVVDGFHWLLATRAVDIANLAGDHAQEFIAVIDGYGCPVIVQLFCQPLVEPDAGATLAVVDHHLTRLGQEGLFG
jgi:hypothetical protein